jgi:hypothetical protein
MSNTRALKAKIIKQIRALQADLQAIERVEEIERRRSGDNAAQDRDKTLIGTVERVLKDDWDAMSVYLGLVQAEWPKASRAAVSTALQRLVARGVAEARGDRAHGFEYRRIKLSDLAAAPPLVAPDRDASSRKEG